MCVYLCDGKCAQLSYNFLWVLCHFMNALCYTYLNLHFVFILILWSILIHTLFVWVGCRKYNTQYTVSSSQHFSIFLYIFPYISPTFLKKFSYFFSYIFLYKPWKSCYMNVNSSCWFQILPFSFILAASKLYEEISTSFHHKFHYININHILASLMI